MKARLVVLAGIAVLVLLLLRERLTPEHHSSGHEARSAAGWAHGSTRSASLAATGLGIAGLVRSSAHGPLANASVCLFCAGCDVLSKTYEPRCVKSDELGRYRFDELQRGDYRLSAAAPHHVPYHAADVRQLRGAALTDVDLELAPGGAAVTGVVVDATGGPIVDAVVRTHFGEGWSRNASHASVQETRSDGSGGFTLHVDESEVGVSAQAEGYSGTSVIVHAPARELRLVLTPAARISGTVLSEQDGEPVSGVRVTARGSEGMSVAISDAAGEFSLADLRPGTYSLEAVGPGFLGYGERSFTVEFGDDVRGVEIVGSHGARVAGTLHAGDGPCETGAVQLVPVRGESAPARAANVLSRGRVEIDGVQPGRYRTILSCDGYDSTSGPLLDVARADLEEQTFRIASGTTVAIRTVSPEGKPVADAWVIMSAADTPAKGEELAPSERQLESNEAGVATFKGVRSGRYTLESPGAPSTTVQVPDAPNFEYTFQVASMGTIEVVVRDERGAPNDRVGVSAEPVEPASNRFHEFGSPRGNGRYAISRLVAGEYRVKVRDRTNASKSIGGDAPVMVRSGEVTKLEAVYGGATGKISGRVVDASGDPLADVWVDAAAVADASDRYREMIMVGLETRVMTDGEGRFELDELAEDGLFRISASHSLGGRARLENVKSGTRVELVLSAPGTLRGTVLSESGEPPAHFSVVASNEAHGQSLQSVFGRASAGRFTIEHVAPGAVTLRAFTPDAMVMQDLQLVAGATLDGITLRLGPPPELARQLAAPTDGERGRSEP